MRKARLDGSGELTLVNTGLREPTGLTMRSGDIYLYWVDPSRDVIERCKVNGKDRVVYRIASGGGLGARVGLGLTLKYVFYVRPSTGRMEKISVDAGVTESEDDGVQIVPSYLVRTGMAGVTDFVVYQDMPMPGTFATRLFLLVDLGPMFPIKGGAVLVPLGFLILLVLTLLW